MGIDHVIDFDCQPKQALSTAGILTRIKARERAEAVQRLYRNHGDMRQPSDMGFEMVRRQADGSEEVKVVIVQEMLDEAAELDPFKHHCKGCPANRALQPFGCFGNIPYPISLKGELWLLKQLPTPDEPLLFLLLSRTMRDFRFEDERLVTMRQSPGVFFESADRYSKALEDAQITTDQVFEMLLLNLRLAPAHIALMLAFFGAIEGNLDASQLMALSQSDAQTDETEKSTAFLLEDSDDDDETISAFKDFFLALYIAHQLNVTVSLDV